MLKRVLGVRARRFCGCELMNSIYGGFSSKGLKKLFFVGGSASPFIDKRDGFTSERVRVRMLPGSVALAGAYKIMVGAYNTVGRYCKVSDARERLRCLLQK